MMATSQMSRPSPKQTKDSLNNKAGIGSGKSSGAGTEALMGNLLGVQTSQLSRPTPMQTKASLNNAAGIGGKTAAAGGDQAPTITRLSTTVGLRPPPTRPGLTEGTVPGYGPDSPASPGQVGSALTIAGSLLTGGVLGAGLGALSEDDTSRTPAMRSLDAAIGAKPGTPVQTRNPIADNTNRRGDDTRLQDRAATAAAAALVGDASPVLDGPIDQYFSDVKLKDRRKPYASMSDDELLGLVKVA